MLATKALIDVWMVDSTQQFDKVDQQDYNFVTTFRPAKLWRNYGQQAI